MALKFQKTFQPGPSGAYFDNIMVLSFSRLGQSDIMETYFRNIMASFQKALQRGISEGCSDNIMALRFQEFHDLTFRMHYLAILWP